MWDSDPNSVEDLEEVTTDCFDWPMSAQPGPSPRAGARSTASSGRRGRKPTVADDAECLVCCLTASGNNFGVATCESCKTFFRRNAKRELSQVRCLHYNNCNVIKEYRRSCTACRLRKCFAVGMRKELILSEEKLRNRARPTFKKPRYRWCRLPASVDLEQLLSVLQAGSDGEEGGSPLIRVKEEAADPDDEIRLVGLSGGDAGDDSSPQRSSPTPSAGDQRFAGRFESSQAFQRLTKCIDEFQQPQGSKVPPGLLMKILYLEDGFTNMDYPIRKLIRMLPELPHFDQLEKTLLGRIIKLKVFGALQMVSAIHYDLARDAWVVPLEQGQIPQEAVVPAREGFYGTFMCLTKRRLLDGRPLCTATDVERMYLALTGFYRELHRVFRANRQLAAVVLMALYLLEDDVPLALTDAEKTQLRQIQWHYLGYLDDIVGLCETDKRAISYTSKKMLLLLMQIRWLDTCYADAAKALQVSKVPPLMQELVTD